MPSQPAPNLLKRALLRTALCRWILATPATSRRRHTRSLVTTQAFWITFWSLVLMAIAGGLYVLRLPESRNGEGWLDDQDIPTVAQIVPAIVIAIFVFAVGVAFVIAQVVPPARGTRAVETLRGRRLRRSVTPAPALILGSVVLVFGPPFASELSGALLIGSFVYTAVSLIYMLSILIDATDPAEFKALLMNSTRRHVRRVACAVRKLPPCRDDCTTWAAFPRPRDPAQDTRSFRRRRRTRRESREARAARQLQYATDQLYEIVRTFRGWARVAARANDSRELQEALEGILELAQQYMSGVLVYAGRLTAVPGIYWSHADDRDDERHLNPLYPPHGMFRPSTTNGRLPSLATEKWLPWEPPALVRRTPPEVKVKDQVRALPCTWFANEIGRAVVRAVELALQSNTLLDRDTARLLNTLTNVAETSCRLAIDKKDAPNGVPEQWAFEWTAGIMIRHLVEVGLGVRHCLPDRIDWYFEPCARLICLQREFRVGSRNSEQGRVLAVGAGAGAVLVAESLVSARAKASAASPAASSSANGPGLIARAVGLVKGARPRMGSADPKGLALREVVADLKRAAGGLLLADRDGAEELTLINEGRLEPRERVAIYRADSDLCATLIRSLAVESRADVARRSALDVA